MQEGQSLKIWDLSHQKTGRHFILQMEILDKYYPADIFSDPESQLSKDIGSQIVTKIREINELRSKS